MALTTCLISEIVGPGSFIKHLPCSPKMNTFAYIKVLDMPLNIQENISLKSMNTFGLESTASHFVEVSTEEETLLALSEKGNYKDPNI